MIPQNIARPGRSAWPDLASLDEATWARAHATIMLDASRDNVFSPHFKIVFLRAFDRVRATILAGAPLAAPCPYRYFRYEHGRTEADGAGSRVEAVLGPAERTLFLLFAGAAAATAEPHLDRTRVYSSVPAGPEEPGLFAAERDCAARFQMAVGNALQEARWPWAVEIDVARAGRTIDREALLGDLVRLGLPDHWASIGRRLWASLEGTMGARGVLGDLGTSGTLVTVGLRHLDRMCAERGHPSFRLIDGLVAPAADAAAAAALERELHACLGSLGLAPNRNKGRIISAEQYLREAAEVEEQRPDRRIDLSSADAAREALSGLERLGEHRFKSEQWALLLLGRLRDPSALEHALSRFADAPWAARIYGIYIGQFLDDPAVRVRYESMLYAARDRLRSWQWMWGLSALWTAPAISPQSAGLLARIAGAQPLPDPVRATAAIVWARFASARGWQALEALAEDSGSSHLRSAIAFGFRYRSPAARQARLAAWARDDPQVALVATAIERDLAAPAGAAQHG